MIGSQPAPRRRRAPAFLSFTMFRRVLLLITGFAALSFLIQAARFFPITGDNMHPEAVNVLIAELWARGLPLYTDFLHPPYALTALPAALVFGTGPRCEGGRHRPTHTGLDFPERQVSGATA